MKKTVAFPAICAMLLATVVLSGCTGAMSDVLVPIDLDTSPVSGQEQIPTASIEVVDLRRELTMRRTTLGEISLGAIILSPPESELARQLVSRALQKSVAEQAPWPERPKIYCGIKTFDVSTPATALYWDVTARIELILRVRGEDRQVSGNASERTYVWPSKAIIGRVTTQALQQVATAAERALPALLGTVP